VEIALLAVSLVLQLVASMQQPWAAEAETWVTEYLQAGRERAGALASYVAVDATMDSRTGSGRTVVGRADFVDAYVQFGYPSARLVGTPFVDLDGAVLSLQGARDRFLVAITVGEDGVASQKHLISMVTAREQGWETVTAAGIPGRVVAQEYQPSSAEDDIYLFHENGLDAPVTEVWLGVRSAGSCPGSTIIGLSLDSDGEISRERRLREIDSARRCGDGEAGDAWWTGRNLPEPLAARVTGSAGSAQGPVSVHNGTSGLHAHVRWALDQFAIAGLEAPQVAAVTFDPYDPYCDTNAGRYRRSTDTVLLCMDEESLAADGTLTRDQQRVLLHELAHAWVEDHTPVSRREDFQRLVGLRGWNDLSSAWDQRAGEWAAEIFVRSLTEGAIVPSLLDGVDPGLLDEGFALLTREPSGDLGPR